MHFVLPTDERASRWDLANDFVSPAAVKQLVDALVPPQPNDSNPFFSDALRDLMRSAHTEVYRPKDESRIELPSASPKGGIAGYCLSPRTRCSPEAFHLPWHWVEANLPKGR